MAIISEDYVSFEVAKLLKKKGFPQEYDVYHSMVYNEEDYEDKYEVQRMVLQTRLVKAGTLSSYPVGMPEPKCYCPTLQMAMKWLREVHHYIIEIHYGNVGSPIEPEMQWWWELENKQGEFLDGNITDGNTTYEEACEAAIKYCLENLI